jgi:AhpD family alkylhydroperoxidase
VDSALHDVHWEDCLIEPRRDHALETYARRKQGFAQPMITCFAPVPWLARALVDQHAEYGLLECLDQDVADLVVLAVSQENSCRYCYAGVRALLWLQGMSQARIARMEQGLARDDLAPRTMAAVAFARAQSRAGPAKARAARTALLLAGYSLDEMKEIAYVAAATDFSNRAHTIPAIPARALERMPDQLHARLLRPLLGWMVKRHRHRGQPESRALDRSSTFAALVNAYAGSPIAPMLRAMVDAMWTSPYLTRRCKLLMWCVVARGLESEACGEDFARALRQEGVDDDMLGRVLAHLDAAELDPVERVLVSFARETVRYEVTLIQRRARAVRDVLEPAQFIEAIGVAALANGLCRLTATVTDVA